MIRLAVRCDEEQAERVLAELLELAPVGVEEQRGEGWVEYAIYGAKGELPALGDVRAVAGQGVVEVRSEPVADDWAERWRAFHRPVTVEDTVHVRPPWCAAPARELVDCVIDPGRGFGTGAHPTTRLCLSLMVRLAERGEASGPLADWGTGSGVLAIAARRLGWDPVAGCDHEPDALADAEANAARNDVAIRLERVDLREGLPPAAATVTANLHTPLLVELAERVAAGGPPDRLVCSGLLARETDEVVAAFAPSGLRCAEGRSDGRWGALLLRSA